ncbi:MAG: ribosomal protein L7/L12 [Anaeromyxobacter sp.]
MQQLTPDQQRQVAAELRAERKIQAIKLYREFTDVGLKEAKDAVEAMEAAGLTSDLSPGTQAVFPSSPAAGGVDDATRRQIAGMVPLRAEDPGDQAMARKDGGRAGRGKGPRRTA